MDRMRRLRWEDYETFPEFHQEQWVSRASNWFHHWKLLKNAFTGQRSAERILISSSQWPVWSNEMPERALSYRKSFCVLYYRVFGIHWLWVVHSLSTLEDHQRVSTGHRLSTISNGLLPSDMPGSFFETLKLCFISASAALEVHFAEHSKLQSPKWSFANFLTSQCELLVQQRSVGEHWAILENMNFALKQWYHFRWERQKEVGFLTMWPRCDPID